MVCDNILIALKAFFYAQNLEFSMGVFKMRTKITLACSECKQRNYDNMKNKKNNLTDLK